MVAVNEDMDRAVLYVGYCLSPTTLRPVYSYEAIGWKLTVSTTDLERFYFSALNNHRI